MNVDQFLQTSEQAARQWQLIGEMHDYTRGDFIRGLEAGTIMPYGQCPTCDAGWESKSGMFPRHRKIASCPSYPGGRVHCTCDSCF